MHFFDDLPELESRCPKGRKTTLYYRSKVEKSAEYLNQDGLVTALTVFADTASKLIASVHVMLW